MVLELYSFKASRPSFDESVVPIKPLLHAIVLKTGHTLNIIITLLNLYGGMRIKLLVPVYYLISC